MKPPLSWLLTAAALTVSSQAAAAQTAPADFGVAGHAAIMTTHGVGAQVYECKADARGVTSWVFREPIAILVQGGRTVGRHYAGPTWELDDGGAVKGRLSATSPGVAPGDVALLKLDVVEHRGRGALADAKLVLRLNTHGGVLKGECPMAGKLRAEPYSADYVFLQ